MSEPSYAAERIRLGDLLATAARLEQAVMCQYLFAAFSMKKSVTEGGVSYAQLEWMRRQEAGIMRVARQEMEHLGLVQNLRCAIGEAPAFDLPEIPFSETVLGTEIDVTLERFGAEVLERFALLELPEKLPESSCYYRFLAKRINGFGVARYDAIARLYDEIRDLFTSIPEKVLFVGPPGAQFNTHDIFPAVIRGLTLSNKAAYDFEMGKVFDRASACVVIDRIIREGEGACDAGGSGSHFAVFMDALIEITELSGLDPGFAPARDVIANPSLRPGAAVPISNPFTRSALALFEVCHQTMMMMLSRFFAFPDNDAVEMAALQQAVFFPMMTTIIRPLGEVLTLLPVAGSGAPRAGASFMPAGGVNLTPHRELAFRVLELRYAMMKEMAGGLLSRSGELPPGVWTPLLKERLVHLHQQIARSHLNLQVNYNRHPDGF